MIRAALSSSRLTVNGRATRARIIDAAAQLMYENGAANTSFEDVRKAAKASGSGRRPSSTGKDVVDLEVLEGPRFGDCERRRMAPGQSRSYRPAR
jgi:hypothetical protein